MTSDIFTILTGHWPSSRAVCTGTTYSTSSQSVHKPVGPNANGAGLSAGFMLSVLGWMFPKYTNKDLAYAKSLPNFMLTQNKEPIHHLRRECHLCLAQLAHSTTADNC